MGGGELQRFAIAVTALQKADIYMFDEPTSYLDIRQRMKVAKVIRDLKNPLSSVVVADHDLSMVDYTCDSVCCLYGKPGAYGVVSKAFGVTEGLNVYLDGFLPDEKIRFRKFPLSFTLLDHATKQEANTPPTINFTYPELVKQLGSFNLKVLPGEMSTGEVISIVGQNGVGKTTFLRMLASALQPDNNATIPPFQVSYKPQRISPQFEGTVGELLQARCTTFQSTQFQLDVIKPLQVEELYQQEVKTLCGGELQRVALVLSLGKSADVYLIDEPSAYLDCEFRITVARIIKRFVRLHQKAAIVVEHDFLMATYLADRVITFDGEPCHDCIASYPQSITTGLNKFLKTLEVTGTRDPTSFRCRLNQLNSLPDQLQRESGKLYIEE